MNRTTIAIAALAAALALPMGVQAQASATASVNATANVLSQLTATAEQTLDFGDVVPGFPATVAPSNTAAAGIVSIAGAPGREVAISFPSIPASLLHELGVETLSLTIESDDVAIGSSAGAPGATFDPAAGTDANLDASGNIWVFVGGQVSATNTQLAGEYTGTITVEVAYTGS